MKNVYLIAYFEGLHYKGTMNVVCATKDIAKGYAQACNNGHYTFSIIKADYLE